MSYKRYDRIVPKYFKRIFKKLKIFALTLFSVFIFIGCATKNTKDVYNKPALYWYKEILKSIRFQDLEKADDHYISMASEHFRSPLLREAMLILSNAHLRADEYILASFYIDEYIKRFSSLENIEFIEFLKIKTAYLSIKTVNKNQKLLLDTTAKVTSFINENKNSIYLDEAKNMLTNLKLSTKYLNDKSATLYKKLGKQKAYKYYKGLFDEKWADNLEYNKPEIPWYKTIFE